MLEEHGRRAAVFCGTAGDIPCLTGAANGPCKAVVEAAAETTEAGVIAERFSAPEFAIGGAVESDLLATTSFCNGQWRPRRLRWGARLGWSAGLERGPPTPTRRRPRRRPRLRRERGGAPEQGGAPGTGGAGVNTGGAGGMGGMGGTGGARGWFKEVSRRRGGQVGSGGGVASGGRCVSGTVGSGGVAATVDRWAAVSFGGVPQRSLPGLDNNGTSDCQESLATNPGFHASADYWLAEDFMAQQWDAARDAAAASASGGLGVTNSNVADIDGMTEGGSRQMAFA